MDAFKLLVSVMMVAAVVSNAWAFSCVPCDDVECTPPLPGCQLGRRVCGCCNECRAREGEQCGAFGVECESQLVCFSRDGVYVGRPPIGKTAIGRCLKYENIPKPSVV